MVHRFALREPFGNLALHSPKTTSVPPRSQPRQITRLGPATWHEEPLLRPEQIAQPDLRRGLRRGSASCDLIPKGIAHVRPTQGNRKPALVEDKVIHQGHDFSRR